MTKITLRPYPRDQRIILHAVPDDAVTEFFVNGDSWAVAVGNVVDFVSEARREEILQEYLSDVDGKFFTAVMSSMDASVRDFIARRLEAQVNS